jgi:hypothetical protein
MFVTKTRKDGRRSCSDCHKLKMSTDFYYRSDGKNLNSICKECTKIRTRRWAKAHREAHNAYQRSYRKRCHMAQAKQK